MSDESEVKNLPAVQGGVPALAPNRNLGLFSGPERFEFGQRAARLLAHSGLVGDRLKGNEPGCFMVLHTAERIGEDPLVVAQNMTFIGNRPGWMTSYMIQRANSSGLLSRRLDWKVNKSDPNNLKVEAFFRLRGEDQDTVGPEVSMAMAIAEGWTSNKKYKSMPEIMLRYRAAAMLIRMNIPEVMAGRLTAEELEDMAASGELVEAEFVEATPTEQDEFEKAAAGKAEKRTPGRPRKARAAQTEETQGEAGEGAVVFNVVDADGVVGTFPDVASARMSLQKLVETAATKSQLDSLFNSNNGELMNNALLAAFNDREAAIVAADKAKADNERRAAEEKAAKEAEAAKAAAEAEPEADAAGAGAEPADDVFFTPLPLDGANEEEYSYELPTQIEELKDDFKRKLDSIVEQGNGAAYTALRDALIPEIPKIQKAKLDDAVVWFRDQLADAVSKLKGGRKKRASAEAPAGAAEPQNENF
ncbi:MAG TPA: hypothetical protein VN838_06795 [Bradyrhizobium sp.]|nr:hypothetical protein [Bradyrhizobium sp.]